MNEAERFALRDALSKQGFVLGATDPRRNEEHWRLVKPGVPAPAATVTIGWGTKRQED